MFNCAHRGKRLQNIAKAVATIVVVDLTGVAIIVGLGVVLGLGYLAETIEPLEEPTRV